MFGQEKSNQTVDHKIKSCHVVFKAVTGVGRDKAIYSLESFMYTSISLLFLFLITY